MCSMLYYKRLQEMDSFDQSGILAHRQLDQQLHCRKILKNIHFLNQHSLVLCRYLMQYYKFFQREGNLNQLSILFNKRQDQQLYYRKFLNYKQLQLLDQHSWVLYMSLMSYYKQLQELYNHYQINILKYKQELFQLYHNKYQNHKDILDLNMSLFYIFSELHHKLVSIMGIINRMRMDLLCIHRSKIHILQFYKNCIYLFVMYFFDFDFDMRTKDLANLLLLGKF